MMLKSDRKYIGIPFKYSFDEALAPNMPEDEQSDEVIGNAPILMVKQEVDSEEEMLDNLIDLIVSTPRGSFHPDPDFGFEFWNHENKIFTDTNFNQNKEGGSYQILCQKSIENSLRTYAPQLENVNVEVEIKTDTFPSKLEDDKKIVLLKRYISIAIQGKRSMGLINAPYKWRKDIPY